MGLLFGQVKIESSMGIWSKNNGLQNTDFGRKWGVQMGIQVGERGSKRVKFEIGVILGNPDISDGGGVAG